MSDIKSPLGTRTFNSNQGMRQFEVPDYGNQPMQHADNMQQFDNSPESIAEFEKRVSEAKKEKRTGGRLSAAAKNRVEMLCVMSRMTREVVIDDNSYMLRTLKSKELKEVVSAIINLTGPDVAFETRKNFLARSIFQISGNDIDTFLGDDSLEAKFEFLDCLEESVITRLYGEYTVLADDSDKKYSIKKESDVKEVIEDLKK